MNAQVIFFTLLHSLWIGLVISILGGIILASTRSVRPSIRYNLLGACLLLFAAGIGGAAFYEWSRIQFVSGGDAVYDQTTRLQALLPSFIEAEEYSLYDRIMEGLTSLRALLGQYTYPLLFTWTIILMYKGFQLAASVRQLKRLRHEGLLPLEESLSQKAVAIKETFGIRSAVRFYYSGLAVVPQVIGWLKPVILIPVGLVNRLSPEQVEAVIAHELAHIRRRDYIVNCLQYLLEVFFFFNPFLLWLSNKIREEREHCCDDLAMQTRHRKKDYVQALIICSEYTGYTPTQALAFIKGKNQLLHRVQRLLTNQNLTFNNMEKIVLICLSVFMMSFASLYGTRIKEIPVISYISDKINVFGADTTKPKKVETKIKVEKNIITTDENGVRKEEKTVIDTVFTIEGRRLEEMGDRDLWNGIFIDDDKIVFPPPAVEPMPFGKEFFTWKGFPDNEIVVRGYQMSDADRKEMEEEMRRAGIHMQKQGKEFEKQIKIYTKDLERSMKDNARAFNFRHNDDVYEFRINQEKIERMAKDAARLAERSVEYLIPQIKIITDSIKYNYDFKYDPELQERRLIEIKKRKQEADKLRNKSEKLKREALILREQGDRLRTLSDRDEVFVIGKPTPGISDARIENIRSQLILDRIINSDGLRSVELTEDQFLVNGVIQSKKIHKKYKKKFLSDGETVKFRYR